MIFGENGNTFVLKAWCKIGAKYKRKIPSPLKGFDQLTIVAFLDRMDKVISNFQL